MRASFAALVLLLSPLCAHAQSLPIFDAHIHYSHDTAPQKVREMLRKYRSLWAELAFRTDHAPGGKLDPQWYAVRRHARAAPAVRRNPA